MAIRDGLQKLVLGEIESYELGLFSGIIGTLLMLPAGFLYFPSQITVFLAVLLILSSLASVMAIWMFLVALDIGEMSVVTPLRRISPVIVAVIEPFFLAVSYNPKIMLGAILCGAGAFITAVKTENMTTPLKDLAQKAALLALGVAILKSLGSVATVYLVQDINYVFLSFFSLLSMAIGFGAITYSKKNELKINRIKRSPEIGLVGVFAVITTIMITYAYSLASATQVMTVKQTTIIFSIVIGGKFFSEENMIRKIIGSLLIIAAVILVSI